MPPPGAAGICADRLRPVKHVVAADTPPDHVRLGPAHGESQRKRGAAIRSEPKLVHAMVACQRVHKRIAGQRRRCLLQRGHQFRDRCLEPSLLLRRQFPVLALEQRETIKCRHGDRLVAVELGEELLE